MSRIEASPALRITASSGSEGALGACRGLRGQPMKRLASGEGAGVHAPGLRQKHGGLLLEYWTVLSQNLRAVSFDGRVERAGLYQGLAHRQAEGLPDFEERSEEEDRNEQGGKRAEDNQGHGQRQFGQRWGMVASPVEAHGKRVDARAEDRERREEGAAGEKPKNTKASKILVGRRRRAERAREREEGVEFDGC